ncbi:hypothetical protein [Adhaeribacter rhizoryzae]|uniref:hypothetical protein n=1 Tax=Adhaeribacter rhizoryzae TaxID=2607907 RepID=UPI00167FE003|nr:hypothetical protein [Adhaeribacter rhizoryzae]
MKHLICIILILFGYQTASAGINPVVPNNTDTATVTTAADSTRNTFTVGLLAGNNSYFFGRSTDIAYPYLAANLSYKFKSGFWVGTTLYHIKGVKNYVDETNLSAGWDVALSDRLEGGVSYTRYIYGSDNPLLQSVASNLATATLSYDWSYLYTSLTAHYLFGEFNDAFLSLNNSRYFEKKGIFSQTDYLGIDPAINILAGTQFFTQSYTTKVEEALTGNNGNGNGNNGNGNGNSGNNGNGNGNSGNNGNNGNNGNGNNGNGNGNNGNGNGNNGNGNGNNGNGNGNNGNGNGNNGNNGNGNNGNNGNVGNGNTGTGTTTTITTTIIQESKFTLLNYGFTLPVIYGFGNNSFELSWRLLVPTNVTQEFSSKPRSFFTFSYYHTF